MATLGQTQGHKQTAPATFSAADAHGVPATTSSTEPGTSGRSPGLDHDPTLRVRPYSIADAPALWRFPGVLRLDVPDSLLLPRVATLDVPAAVPILRKERPAFVAVTDSQRIGFVRFSPRRPDGRWILSAIGASTGVYAPEPVWEALLAHGVRAAGLRGVRRLFARVPVGHAVIETMHQNGWSSYARETVFRAERLNALEPATRAVRVQEPPDTWAIHQLYAASSPRQVQEIEAMTSHVWDMDRAGRTLRGIRQSGWLLEESGALAAYARHSRGPRAGMIDAVVLPGKAAQLGILLDAVITATRHGRPRPVYCALRSYLLDMEDELTKRGFTPIGEQELLIRYTTASARSSQAEPVHFPVELRQGMPRRVPTFLESQPTDGTI